MTKTKRLVASLVCAALALGPAARPAASAVGRGRGAPPSRPALRLAPPGSTPARLAPAAGPAALEIPVLPAAAAAGEARTDRSVRARAAEAAAPSAVLVLRGAARGVSDPGADVPSRLGGVYDGGGFAAAPAVLGAEAPLPPRAGRERRSVAFPLGLLAASALGWAALKGAEATTEMVTAQSMSAMPADAPAWGWAAGAALLAVAVSTVLTLWDAGRFVGAMWAGRKVTPSDFQNFLARQVYEGKLDANAAALIRPNFEKRRFLDTDFGFSAQGRVWVRPQLIVNERLFHLVVVHEFRHLRPAATRGPPGRGLLGLARRFLRETHAYVAESLPGGLRSVRVSNAERGLRRAALSLARPQAYEMLLVDPDVSRRDVDEGVYARLSGGAARVSVSPEKDAVKALSAGSGKGYGVVVLDNPAALVPDAGSPADAKRSARLSRALERLDSLHVLATRLRARPQGFVPGSPDARSYAELADRAAELRAAGAPSQQMEDFQKKVRALWQSISAKDLPGTGVAEAIAGLNGSMRDQAVAILSFKPGERGVGEWERLLRYWESPEGDRFDVTREDVEDGGHVLVLRKIEPRVSVWLRPVGTGAVGETALALEDGEGAGERGRGLLAGAGYGGQEELFRTLGVRVRHSLQAAQLLCVTVPRRHREALTRSANSVAATAAWTERADFSFHLMDAGPLQGAGAPAAYGVDPRGKLVAVVDTGLQVDHSDFGGNAEAYSMVAGEGVEDTYGHGTHVAAIVGSTRRPYLGIAPGVSLLGIKVFSRFSPGSGASDAEIIPAMEMALARGADVLNLSLGVRDVSYSVLSDFASKLTERPNPKGEYMIVVASAGNSGPFRRTLSSPGNGGRVTNAGAATKRRRSGFYSAVGPDVDDRYWVSWLRRIGPSLLGVGGDVITRRGDPDVFSEGVGAAKSKDSSPSPSDLGDGHTRISGTSQAAPAVSAATAQLKAAIERAGAYSGFIFRHLPFGVQAILMQSAEDLGEPLVVQGAGLLSIPAALRLVFPDGVVVGTIKSLLRVSRPDFSWIERLKGIDDAEAAAFAHVLIPDGPRDPAQRDKAIKAFVAARDAAVPGLLAALKDDKWLVRQRAVLALMNLRSAPTEGALLETGLRDPDSRVRRAALYALGEWTPLSAPTLAALADAARGDKRPDVALYAAYALIRRGDRSGMERVLREMGGSDPIARLNAVWIAGESSAAATPAEAEALAARVADPAEEPNARHHAAAALSYLAEEAVGSDDAPAAVSDAAVRTVLSAAGPDDLALTGTIGEFFSVAVNDQGFVDRLRGSLKPDAADFVLRNRDAIHAAGGLGELVRLIARAADVPLDAPTPAMDPNGAGVAGVDPVMGPLDVIVTLPRGAPAPEPGAEGLGRAFQSLGLHAEALERHEASVGFLPLTGAAVLSVPEHKLTALYHYLASRGFDLRSDVQRALPAYATARGGGEGVSEAREMARLEGLSAAGGVIAATRVTPPGVSAAAAGQIYAGYEPPLRRLVSRLSASALVVVPAGNDPFPGRAWSTPPRGPGVVSVAAASRKGGLQYYSQTRDVSWAALVDHLDKGAHPAAQGRYGTGAAAEAVAESLSRLLAEASRAFASAGRPVPPGLARYVASVAGKTLAPLPRAAGSPLGLFDEAAAARELRRRLKGASGLDAAAREAAALAVR